MNDLSQIEIVAHEKHIVPGELKNYHSEFILNNKKKAYQTIWFDSVADVVKCVAENTSFGTWDDRENAGQIDKQKTSWMYGSDLVNYNKTKEFLNSGICPERFINTFEAKVKQLYDKFPELNDLDRSAQNFKRRRVFSEAGDDLNIDRYMSGEIEMWERKIRQPEKRTLKIAFNGGVNASIKPDDIANNMIAAIAFMDIVQNAGISVEFWYCFAVSGVSDTLANGSVIFLKLKSASDPLDISRMLSAGAPGLFRYFIFKTMFNVLDGKVPSYLGSAVYEVPATVKELYDFDVCVSATDSEYKIVNVFTDKLKEINI